MKLLRLDAKASGHTPGEVDIGLAIHPQMTVVLGAEGAARDTLIEAIAGIPRGVASTGGVIEVGGVHESLSAESLARLGLRTDLNVVVRAADLPGHDLVTDERIAARHAATIARDQAQDALRRAEAAVEDKRRAHEERSAALDELRAGGGDAAADSVAAIRDEAAASLGSATAERTRLEADLERLRVEHDALIAARTEAQRAAAERTAAEAAQSERAPDSPAVSDLQTRRDDLQRRIAVLAAQDPVPVLACLDRIEGSRNAEGVPIPAALAFADAWRDMHQQLAGLERDETPEEREARTKLDAARRAAVQAERDLRVSAPAPESIAELEAAHNAVLEAQEKTNSRFSGTRARIRLDQLRAVERNALERLGFSTYADYMMSASSRGVGAGKRAVLQTARVHMAEAEAEWQALGGDVSRDAWRADLLEQRSAIAPRIALLLGHEPAGADVEEELRALRAAPPADPGVIEELRSALAGIGLEVDDEDLGQEELLRLARAWIDENERLDARRAALRVELRAIEDQLAGAEAQGVSSNENSEPEISGHAPVDLADVERRVVDLETALAEAAASRALALEREAAAGTRLSGLDAPEAGSGAALESLLAEAGERIERARAELVAAEIEVEQFRADLASADERLRALIEAEESAPAAPSVPDEDREGLIEDIEWYLLSRLAAQRAVGDAGSVPLVLDDTFRDLDVTEAVRVMESVERLSGAVQVIAVSDDRALSFWAEALGEERAGVVSLGG